MRDIHAHLLGVVSDGLVDQSHESATIRTLDGH